MNAKRIILLSCVVALVLPVSAATGQSRGARHGAAPAPVRSTMSRHPFFNDRREDRFESRHPSFNDRREDRLENRRFFRNRFVSNRFVFIDTFGFPFFYPYPYYGYYPYGYYPYGYDYNYYGDSGYGYGSGSSVVELQRRLARAGYYHGAIDGIMGPATRRAMRAYERDHNQSAYGMTDRY